MGNYGGSHLENTLYEIVAGDKPLVTRSTQVFVRAAPLPQVSFFNASSGATPPTADEVLIQGGDTYQVLVGSQVKLSWATLNATSVQLRAIDNNGVLVDYGDRPTSGDFTFRYDGTIRQLNLMASRLDAVGSPVTVSKSVIIEAREIDLPPPYNLVGSVENNQNKLTWSYDSILLDRIRLFRLYRASSSDMNFLPVAELERTITTWVDPIQPNCGYIYFVVATYTDVNGNLLETDPSATSWFSPLCS